MNLRPFGRTDLQVSDLCLGAMNFGWNTDDRTSRAILDTFCAQGGNFVQAASGVNAMGTALSELHVGNWISGRDVERSELVLATNLVVRHEGATRRSLTQFIRLCCEASLRRLRVEYLDLFLCDMRSMVLPIDALLEALSDLIDEGLVRHVGASRFPAWRLGDAHACSIQRSLPRFEAVQDDYSLVARSWFEAGLAASCRATGAAFLARSPLAGGFLTDAAGRQSGWVPAGTRMRLGGDSIHDRRPGLREVIEMISAARDATIAQTALAWVLAQPQVTSAVVGVTSPEELLALIDGTAEPLDARDAALLENPLALDLAALANITAKPAGRANEFMEILA